MRCMVGTVSVGLALILPVVAASQQESDNVAAAPSLLGTVLHDARLTIVRRDSVG